MYLLEQPLRTVIPDEDGRGRIGLIPAATLLQLRSEAPHLLRLRSGLFACGPECPPCMVEVVWDRVCCYVFRSDLEERSGQQFIRAKESAECVA